MKVTVTGTKHKPFPTKIKEGQVFLNTRGGLNVVYAVENGSVKLLRLRKHDYQIIGQYSYCERYLLESNWRYVGECEIPDLHIQLF